MRLAIDIREACRGRRAGKGQWVFGCVSEMLGRGLDLALLTDAPLPDVWREYEGAAVTLTGGAGWHIRALRYLRKHRPDAYLSPTSYIVPFLAGTSVPCVPVVHDLIAFRGEPHDLKATLVEKLTLGRTVRTAHHILTVSESTKRDLLARYPGTDPARVTSIFAGPSETDPSPAVSGDTAILCVGTLCPRKNQERLIRAYASLPSPLRERHPLILAGSRGWHDEGIVAAARSTTGVSWKGYVDDAGYRALLGEAAVFAFPSLYEGFGIAVLDALARGVPVLTSDRGSLMEVAGNAAVRVDPESIDSIAAGLRRILEDVTLRDRLRSEGPAQAARFSWNRTVDLVLGAIS